jgi:hypothetical protein
MDNARGRAGHARSRGTAWARRAITLAVLAAGVWSVAAGRAEAGPAPIVKQFTCPLPVIGTQSVTISVAPPALRTATVGVPSPRLPVSATATVIAAARLVVSFLGAKWAEGTGVMAGEVDSPQGKVKEGIGFTVPRTDVATGSGPLSVSGSGVLPSLTFSRPGEGEILATGLTFHLSMLTSGGGQAFLSPFNITCALASGQSAAVEPFRILPAAASKPVPSPARSAATGSPVPRRPTPSPRPARSAATLSPTPRPTPSPSPVPSSPAPLLAAATPPPRSPSRASGLLWLAGIAVAGGLAAAAWLLLRRWLPRRPAA